MLSITTGNKSFFVKNGKKRKHEAIGNSVIVTEARGKCVAPQCLNYAYVRPGVFKLGPGDPQGGLQNVLRGPQKSNTKVVKLY